MVQNYNPGVFWPNHKGNLEQRHWELINHDAARSLNQELFLKRGTMKSIKDRVMNFVVLDFNNLDPPTEEGGLVFQDTLLSRLVEQKEIGKPLRDWIMSKPGYDYQSLSKIDLLRLLNQVYDIEEFLSDSDPQSLLNPSFVKSVSPQKRDQIKAYKTWNTWSSVMVNDKVVSATLLNNKVK